MKTQLSYQRSAIRVQRSAVRERASVLEYGDSSPLSITVVPSPKSERRQVGALHTLARVFALLCLWLAAACSLQAQSFTLDWSTVDGGGTSSGGVYSVTGTVGQPDVGRMSGGPFTVEGGFWGVIAAIQTPGAPWLTIALNPQLSTLIVAWHLPAEGWVLEQTSTLSGAVIPWSPVPANQYQTNATQCYITVPSPAGNKFYRLRKP